MRTTCSAMIALCALAVCGPAHAIEASDTMAAWSSASADEKAKLAAEVLKRDGREGGAAGVVKCLDAASGVPGHADLPIRTVVKACAKQDGEPV